MLLGMNVLDYLHTLQGMPWGDQVKPKVVVVEALNDSDMIRQEVFRQGQVITSLSPIYFSSFQSC